MSLPLVSRFRDSIATQEKRPSYEKLSVEGTRGQRIVRESNEEGIAENAASTPPTSVARESAVSHVLTSARFISSAFH